MVACDYCGKDEYMPFRCKYCGGYFCAEHRLPEFHDCPGLYQSKPRWEPQPQRTYTGYRAPPRRSILGLWGRNELRDLAVGMGAIMLILLSSYWRLMVFRPLFMLGALLIYALAFILHELAHKFAAQKLGYWAEFKLSQQGLLLTLLSLVSPFKLIAPGAVMVSGLTNWDDYGRISIAGPLSNIAMGTLFLALRLTTGSTTIASLATIGTNINASLSLFNLIPFGIFDGAKVVQWDKGVWVAAVLASLALYLLSI